LYVHMDQMIHVATELGSSNIADGLVLTDLRFPELFNTGDYVAIDLHAGTIIVKLSRYNVKMFCLTLCCKCHATKFM